MYSEIPTAYLYTAIAISAVAVLLLVLQIVLATRLHILTLCKITVLLPIAYLLVVTTKDISNTIFVNSKVMELSPAIWQTGIVSSTATISLGIIITAILSIAYGVTSTIIRNRTKKD